MWHRGFDAHAPPAARKRSSPDAAIPTALGKTGAPRSGITRYSFVLSSFLQTRIAMTVRSAAISSRVRNSAVGCIAGPPRNPRANRFSRPWNFSDTCSLQSAFHRGAKAQIVFRAEWPRRIQNNTKIVIYIRVHHDYRVDYVFDFTDELAIKYGDYIRVETKRDR